MMTYNRGIDIKQLDEPFTFIKGVSQRDIRDLNIFVKCNAVEHLLAKFVSLYHAATIVFTKYISIFL